MGLSNTVSAYSGKKMYFLKVNEGQFKAEGEEGSYNTVEGTLKGLSLVDDPGNKASRVKPYTALVLNLEDEENIYRLKVHSEITFSWILGKFLANTKKGDLVRLKVMPGKDPKVSIPKLYRSIDGGSNFVPVEGIEFPEDQAERLKTLYEVVESHPAYYVPKAKTDQSS